MPKDDRTVEEVADDIMNMIVEAENDGYPTLTNHVLSRLSTRAWSRAAAAWQEVFNELSEQAKKVAGVIAVVDKGLKEDSKDAT